MGNVKKKKILRQQKKKILVKKEPKKNKMLKKQMRKLKLKTLKLPLLLKKIRGRKLQKKIEHTLHVCLISPPPTKNTHTPLNKKQLYCFCCVTNYTISQSATTRA